MPLTPSFYYLSPFGDSATRFIILSQRNMSLYVIYVAFIRATVSGLPIIIGVRQTIHFRAPENFNRIILTFYENILFLFVHFKLTRVRGNEILVFVFFVFVGFKNGLVKKKFKIFRSSVQNERVQSFCDNLSQRLPLALQYSFSSKFGRRWHHRFGNLGQGAGDMQL